MYMSSCIQTSVNMFVIYLCTYNYKCISSLAAAVPLSFRPAGANLLATTLNARFLLCYCWLEIYTIGVIVVAAVVAPGIMTHLSGFIMRLKTFES